MQKHTECTRKHGKPVAKIIPYKQSDDILKSLRNSVKKYLYPTEPVGLSDWDILK